MESLNSSSMNYKVSICTPIYGVEKYIERCARSLFEQTYENIEFVFVNDCTKDCSIEVLNSVIKEYSQLSSRIKIINHTSNKGLAAARNTAVDNATGDFIMHVDSDDYIVHDAVSKLVAFQKETDCDFISFEAKALYPKYEEIISVCDYSCGIELCHSILRSVEHPYIWQRFIKRDLYVTNNVKCEEGVNMGEDMQVTPKLAYYSTRIAVLHEILYVYEARNLSAYTKSYSEVKEMQKDLTIQILSDFFYDKDGKFKESIEIAKYLRLISKMVDACKYRKKNIYKESYGKAICVPSYIISKERNPKTFLIHVPSYTIARLYILTTGAIKRTLKRLL